ARVGLRRSRDDRRGAVPRHGVAGRRISGIDPAQETGRTPVGSPQPGNHAPGDRRLPDTAPADGNEAGNDLAADLPGPQAVEPAGGGTGPVERAGPGRLPAYQPGQRPEAAAGRLYARLLSAGV